MPTYPPPLTLTHTHTHTHTYIHIYTVTHTSILYVTLTPNPNHMSGTWFEKSEVAMASSSPLITTSPLSALRRSVSVLLNILISRL